MIKDKIGQEYLHALQAKYHIIDKRGIAVSQRRLNEAKTFISRQITINLEAIKNVWNCHVYVGSANDDGSDNSINLNSTQGSRRPLDKLKNLGYDIPRIAARDEDGNYISKESLGELVLQKMLSTNQFNHPAGDPAILAILNIRELAKLRDTYVNANLANINGVPSFITNYNVVGTTTYRRSSKRHVYGFGNNAQNFPKHGHLAEIYRRCLVARTGKILLMVDQMQAEDWPVSALAGNTKALKELEDGVDRHLNLALAIFNLRIEDRTSEQWKESIERYMGKKTRHANNYDMKGNTMSEALAKEGKVFTPAVCNAILARVNEIDPSVDKVFHQYVKDELDRTRCLKSPTGAENTFFGLRPGQSGSNGKIYREAYSWIPQNTVGCNTGFTLYALEDEYPVKERSIIQEGHDSLVQEIDDSPVDVWEYLQRTLRAGKRKFQFYNGIEIEIPWEAEIGFDFKTTVTFKSLLKKTKKIEDLSYSDVTDAYYKLKAIQAKQLEEDAKNPPPEEFVEQQQLESEDSEDGAEIDEIMDSSL